MASRTANFLLKSLLPALIAAALAAPVVLLFSKGGFDYQVHIDLASEMLRTGTLKTPHFLFQAGTIMLAPLSGGLSNAAVTLVLLAEAATAMIVARFVLTGWEPTGLALPVIVAILFVAPVAMLFPLDRHLYLGYIGINTFHNPTMFILKPLALLSFAYTLKALQSETAMPISTYAISLILTVACALAKPSYTIVIIPSLVIMIVGMLATGRHFDWKFLLFSVGIPAVAILLVQYRMTYVTAQLQGFFKESGSIIFAPLVVMKSFSEYLIPKILLSLPFPLAVLLTDRQRALRDPGLQLGWLAWVVGTFYAYFMAESGPKMFDANFVWSAQIALFILFATSAAHLLQRMANRQLDVLPKSCIIICFATFLLHVIAGIAFYCASLFNSFLY